MTFHVNGEGGGQCSVLMVLGGGGGCPQEHRACTELLCRSGEWRGGEGRCNTVMVCGGPRPTTWRALKLPWLQYLFFGYTLWLCSQTNLSFVLVNAAFSGNDEHTGWGTLMAFHPYPRPTYEWYLVFRVWRSCALVQIMKKQASSVKATLYRQTSSQPGNFEIKQEINMTQGINSYTANFKFSLAEMNQNYKLKFAIDEQSNHLENWVPFRWATENFFFYS